MKGLYTDAEMNSENVKVIIFSIFIMYKVSDNSKIHLSFFPLIFLILSSAVFDLNCRDSESVIQAENCWEL